MPTMSNARERSQRAPPYRPWRRFLLVSYRSLPTGYEPDIGPLLMQQCREFYRGGSSADDRDAAAAKAIQSGMIGAVRDSVRRQCTQYRGQVAEMVETDRDQDASGN